MTPGRTDDACTFSVPANHRLFVWLEWWKDGKLKIDDNCNSDLAPTRDEKVDARLTPRSRMRAGHAPPSHAARAF